MEAVSSVTGEAFRPSLVALILTGSLARKEGTWLRKNGRDILVGDAEFLAVFGEHDLLPANEIAVVQHEIECRLYQSGVEAHIGISPVRPRYLRSLRPHIFAYELREHGRVVWGEKRILDMVPRFSPSEIPLDDAFRLLMNRIIELLEQLCQGGSGMSFRDMCSDAVYYRLIKLWLDMATSFLVFSGQFASTYWQRAELLVNLASNSADTQGSLADTPIPLNRFAEQVLLATRQKLDKAPSLEKILLQDLRPLVEDVRALWRWELARLTQVNGAPADDELLKRWLRSQDLAGRVRGWLATAKRYGVRRSVRIAPRWLRLACKGSPRRLIYAAASRLFFSLPNQRISDLDLSTSRAITTDDAVQYLPVRDKCRSTDSWQMIGQAVARNYHQFLEPTRS